MIYLLAYLLIRRDGGKWSVTSHRDLEGLKSDWKAILDTDAKASAVVHVGFWRPDTSSFDQVCSDNEGRVLLTGAAKFALPQAFTSAERPCSVVENLPIYMALSGWGYEIEEPVAEQASLAVGPGRMLEIPSELPKAPIDWLENLQRDSPDLFAECAKLSILSEAHYQQNERLLPLSVRNRLGAYRFKAFNGYPPSRNMMLDGLMFAPPWVLRLSIYALNLPIRATNRLKSIGAESVEGIAKFGPDRLMRVPSLGRKTISDISEAIYAAFELGSAHCDAHAAKQGRPPDISRSQAQDCPIKPDSPPQAKYDDTPSEEGLEPPSFREALHAAFALLSEREASVLRQRMGIGGSKKTLEEIAKDYNVTRERIRQIESKAINRLVTRMPVWERRFKQGLARMLEGRQMPLPLLGLTVLDPWFNGASTLVAPFEFALENLINPPEFAMIRVGGQSYVSMLRQDEWIEAERASKALLESLSKRDKAPSESETRLLIISQFVGRGEELRPLLWDTVTRWAHFSERSGGERVLVSYGMGAESLVEAVLSESDTPLHYSEIAKRCALKGRTIDNRRAANAAANVGYLLGRGIYGLQKHIDLSRFEQSRVLGEVEEMLSETPARQWHAKEIIDELEARGLDFEGRLSKYDLNVILESSTVLAYLGRMVWTTGTKESLGTSARLNIWQAIVALVQQHGSPMLASDIREILSKDRGLNSFFQIQQADPLIRVGENEWGILWRDVPFDESDANAIVDEIVSVLSTRGSGLHISEIIPSLTANRGLAERANPILLPALAVRTERVKSGKGGYVYLSEWEGPRRLTISEAVEKAFDTFNDGVLAADVAKKASELLGREVIKSAATSILMRIGAYDPGEGLWFHPEASAETLEELDEEA
jgi:RNA polymerase sigma factor (sigma-70 family)